MQPISHRSRSSNLVLRGALAVVCTALLVPGNVTLWAQQTPSAAGTATEQAAALPAEQLDSLVAPIALYPDPLLAQTLAASTYPLELIQLQQFLAKNPKLKDKALADAVAKQPWDPAVQSMAAFPDVVKRLADDVQWATDLGNAFLAQQSDVMDAVQRMRKKAQDKGSLSSNEQQKVETKVVETKTVIIVEPANPEVIYVPTYSPTVVYPPPVYPYPPIYYPPYPPGAAFVTFTAGVMIGAAIWGGAWGHCGWGHNDVNINVNNNFNNINRNTNISGNRGGGNNWQHNSQHRGGAPYANKATASKYGGTAKGDSLSSRQATAQKQARGGASASQQGRGGTSGGASASQQGRSGTSGGATASQQGRGGTTSGGSRGASASASKGGGGFGGGSSGGNSGSSARASSSRGASSFGGRSGGGGRRR
jgi:hypothetical protein